MPLLLLLRKSYMCPPNEALVSLDHIVRFYALLGLTAGLNLF